MRIPTLGHLVGGVVYTGAFLLLAVTVTAQVQYTYTTLGVPGAHATFPNDISGNNIVGTEFSNVYVGFLYNGTSYSYGSSWTENVYYKLFANGISGSNIVGYYQADPIMAQHGFLYDGINFTNLDVPGALSTAAYGIDGNNIVGSYVNDNGGTNRLGFLYDGNNYTTFSVPGAAFTNPRGISGSNIVGYYCNDINETDARSFLYNGSSYITLSVPGAVATYACGISGNYIVGYYENESGYAQSFLYDGSNYTTLSGVLGASETRACGIDGNKIVGWYYTNCIGNCITWGFLATPAPVPQLQAVATNSTLQVTVSMPSPYYSTIIQASTNLVDWVNICTNTPPFTLTNSTATTAPYRFYRALLGP